MNEVKQRYEKRRDNYNTLLKKQQKAEKEISIMRLLIFIIGVNTSVYTYITHKYTLFPVSMVLFLAIFIYLVVTHNKIRERIKYTTFLRDINIISLKRLNDQWSTFIDDGEDFKDDSHGFIGDLDIFGKKSLFQWINTANTFNGRQELRKLLSGIMGRSNDIRERQEAITELAAKLNWRQRFSVEGMIISGKMSDPEDIIEWASNINKDFRKPLIINVIRLLPCITIALIIGRFILNIIPLFWPLVAIIIQFFIIRFKEHERFQLLNISENYNKDLKAYYNMLKAFETKKFKSLYVGKIKDGIRSEEGLAAYKQIDRLSSIINSISNRRNSFYAIINVLTLWDLQTVIALEHWKEKSGQHLKDWLDALGKMEALSSLAVIACDNPDWVIPTIYDGEEAILIAKDIGHPLLSANRVRNNLTINKKTKSMLITGSNMSGKSTLLRTSGINLVLAYTGAPVCAKYFQASIMEIYTCMRVSDNLGESISSFYAELIRIKKIVSEAETGKRIFYLLDEIFKGTNSIDRHTGARVLINKLSHTNSIGMVSTHDLELCELEKENDRIVNYHFQEYYEGDKLNFDYKLRPGASTTRNALFLMKLAGLDIDEKIKE